MEPYAYNRTARHDYEILETLQAGLVLVGHEVKSIRAGRASLKGAHAIIRANEVWLLNANIPPYQVANTPDGYDPTRTRKLLLKRKDIDRLIGKVQNEGLTIVPIKLYNSNRKIKLELALARGKKKHDKRETIKKRDAERDMQRAMRVKE